MPFGGPLAVAVGVATPLLVSRNFGFALELRRLFIPFERFPCVDPFLDKDRALLRELAAVLVGESILCPDNRHGDDNWSRCRHSTDGFTLPGKKSAVHFPPTPLLLTAGENQ